MLRVAVLDDYQRVARDCADWDTLDADIEFFHDHLSDEDALVERLSGFDVIVAMRERTPFRRGLLGRLGDLKLLVTTGMRNASIDVAAANELGVTVCGTSTPGFATAELTFALIQALARGLLDETSSVRSGGWQVGLGRDLRGSTLGVIGVGRMGRLVAGFGNAFGMNVLAWSQNLTDEQAGEVGARRVTKETLLAASDFVTIHVRLSDRTRGLIGAGELASMKPTAYLVNTSRGPIVDEQALLDAVRSGTIRGAAIDVFEHEPLPADHPFRTEPRIIATPHVGYVTEGTYRVFFPEAIESIQAWQSGDPIRVLAQ